MITRSTTEKRIRDMKPYLHKGQTSGLPIRNANMLLDIIKFNTLLEPRQLRILDIPSEEGDCFYEAVSYGISHLAHPFNVAYTPTDLRYKASAYMRAHSSEFLSDGHVRTEEEMIATCNLIATTKEWASAHIEGEALAHACQMKIEIYELIKYFEGGEEDLILIGERGITYPHVIKIALLSDSAHFLPIVELN